MHRLTAMSADSLAQRVNSIARLTGTFTLRSGQVATEYFDKYRFEADPVLLADIAAALAPLLPSDTEVLAGLELGGVPIATALSLHTGLPAAFVRKEAKTYGTAQLAEGADIARQARHRDRRCHHHGRAGGDLDRRNCVRSAPSSTMSSA